MNRFFTEYAGRVPLSPRRCVAGNRKIGAGPLGRKSGSAATFDP
jgi:hypothetical protein